MTKKTLNSLNSLSIIFQFMKRSFSFMLFCLHAYMVSAQISHTAKGDVDKTAQSLLQKAAKVSR